MTWEILWRGRWTLVLTTLSAITVPAIIFTALRSEGAIHAHDSSMLIMHIVMLHIIGLCCGAAIFGVQGRWSLLYSYPAKTSVLVAWRLLPAMAIMSLQMALVIAAINAIFELDWPIWGPALIAPVVFAAVEAAAWLTDKSTGWMIVAVLLVGGFFGLWLKARYGPAFSQPTHYWRQVTPAEMLTMAAMTAAAFCVAWLAVARNRRGEPPVSVGVLEWLTDKFDRSRPARMAWKNPIQAQCWFEWQRKGHFMPVAVFVVVVLGVILWALVSRRAEELVVGFLGGGYVQLLIAFVAGLYMGNVGPSDSDFRMGHFLATRPMSDADMGRSMLKTAAKSVLLAWSIWALAFAIALGAVLAVGAGNRMLLPPGFHWAFFPTLLLGSWIIAGMFMSFFLLCAEKYFPRVVFTLVAILVFSVLIPKFLLSAETRLLLMRVSVALFSTAILVGTLWAFNMARKRMLIPGPVQWAVASCWLAAVVVGVLAWPAHAQPSWIGYLLLAAVLALVATPLAAVPLALSWNRHR
jgi:hypothetical protein